MNKIYRLAICISLLISINTDAQAEAGLPFITSFSPRDYNAGVSNWAVLQDARGVMYFGNDQGVLEYDGTTWRVISLTNSSNTRSLDMDENGRIYVGGVGNFGYLQANELGITAFVSLMKFIPDSLQQFTDVWHTFSTTQGIYFITDNCIFLWTGSEIKAWPSEDRYHVAAIIKDTLYVRTWNKGLMRMQNNSLQLVPGGEQFADERIYVMLPYDENRILVGARTKGLLLYDGKKFSPFKTEVDNFLLEHHIYLPGAVLPDGSFALGTFTGGLVIIDRQGKLLLKLDKTSGLNDNAVCYVYPEPNGAAVWLGLYNGIARVEIPSPLSFFHDRAGLEFPVMDITRHKGTLYAGTNIGIFQLDSEKGIFKQIPGTKNQCFQFEHVDDILLATALEDGVYSIDNGNATVIRKSINYDFRANSLLRSKQDPSLVFVGLDNGVSILRWRNRQWNDEGRITDVHEDAVSLAEDAAGNLWIGSISFGAIKVSFTKGTENRAAFQEVTVKRFGEESGLSSGLIYTFQIDNDVLFTAQNGLLRFDETTESFYSDTIFTNIGFDGSSLQTFIVEDEQKNVWLNLGRETVLAERQANGSFSLNKTPFLRFANLPAYTIYPETDGTVWFGGGEAIIRYDPSIKKEYSRTYPALIREVRVNEDSVLYGGSVLNEQSAPPQISYAHNNIRFTFAASSYDSPEAIRLKTMLEGFDTHWSTWSNESSRVYTNLPFGEYTFRVLAKNVYNQLSEEAVFSFEILPPWYRTWWAYGIYLLILGFIVYAGDRLQRQRLVKRERQRAELLSKIGKDLTGSLDSDTIFYKLYENVNQLLDAAIFGVGIYHPEKQEIEYRLAIEKGKKYEPYSRDMKDKDQFPVWCIDNREVVFINDIETEHSKYLKNYSAQKEVSLQLEDGSASEEPQSLIYLPLIANEEVLGIITIQSFKKNAYKNYHLTILQNLAAYTTIALDNANAYRQLNDIRDNLEITVEERTAEIQTQIENIEQLSEIGKEITASLDIDTIFFKLYEHVNRLVDATVFGVGVYHEENQQIEFRLAIEKGKRYAPYTRDTHDKNQFPVWCIENSKPVFINDVETEYSNYISQYIHLGGELEDGTVSENPASMIYLPLTSKKKVLGIITVQSFQKNAYTDYHLKLLQNLAAYTSIALDNADAYRQLASILENLKSTQQQLVTQEKLASLGALTAGIAHEIKNPLNFVNNFAELSQELVDELREELEKNLGNAPEDEKENIHAILADLEQNSKKINEHGKRADSIVKGMLQHSRGTKGERQPTDINSMLEEDINLAYHGLRAQDSGFNATIEKDFDENLGKVEVVPQDISRVFLNIITNGFYAAHQRSQQNGKDFSPKLSVQTRTTESKVEIRIRDNGHGIPEDVREKIFQPFFTTKPTGQGTGLGLSISYDIVVQEHNGEIRVDSKEGEFTEFVISLPR